MRILLFGRTGQVGWELQRSLAPLGELVALDHRCSELGGDLSDLDGIAQTVRTVAPDVIVNAAAYTQVDRAESEPDLARAINGLAPGVIAAEAKQCGAWLYHYSTDYVFDGSGDKPWTEDDPVGPLNVYGETKLEGERLIQQSGCKHIIFRTSWVYAARGNNFVRTMLRLARERASIEVVHDQIGSPTGAELLADITAHAIRIAQQEPGMAGLYHLTAAGEVSWHDYACFVLEQARKAGLELKVTAEAVRAIPTSAFATRARRPLNSRLDSSKFRHAFGLELPHWQSGVARMLTEIMEKGI